LQAFDIGWRAAVVELLRAGTVRRCRERRRSTVTGVTQAEPSCAFRDGSYPSEEESSACAASRVTRVCDANHLKKPIVHGRRDTLTGGGNNTFVVTDASDVGAAGFS
jgi:hypothetical protein